MRNQPIPLKRFGQNYLTDKNITRKIVDEFNPSPDDFVLEIGPGTGALTSLLHDKVKKYIAVEIDKRVIDSLKNTFANIEIINKDFLDLDLTEFSNQNMRVIGNIPYNITSPILFKLIENRKNVKDVMLMVQYEVAKRITSRVGTKDYGILGVILNYFAETKLCFKISPNVFYPKPKVFSAIIHIKFDKDQKEDIDDRLFINVVKASFGNRRKTLKNSLSNSIFGDINFDSLSYLLTRRAEELSINDFVELAVYIKEKLNGRRDQES